MFSDEINIFEDISNSYVNMEKSNKNKMSKVIENVNDLIKLLDTSYTSFEVQEKVKILKRITL